MKYLYAIAFIMALHSCRSQKEIHPFTTDKCSCFPEGTKTDPRKWEHCCIAHDSLYWKGQGTRKDRKRADILLCDCVKKTGAKGKAKLMYLGVRFGGGRLMPFPWRWGYGWGYFQRKRITSNSTE